MRRLGKTIALLFLPAAAAPGCDDGSGPEPSVLTTLEVAPSVMGLYTVAPGTTAQLVVVGRDQRHAVLEGVDFSFHSPNNGVASVSADGLVSAAAAGTVEIGVSATFEDVTLEGSSSITVRVAPATETVTAFTYGLTPHTAHVSAGGTVTWTFEGLHEVDFTTPGAPADIPRSSGGSFSRVFPTSGTFAYRCLLPHEDFPLGRTGSGVVVVH